MNQREIYEKIEETISSYGNRRVEDMLSRKAYTTEQLHELRGRAQACKEIAGAIRNALGYTVEEL